MAKVTAPLVIYFDRKKIDLYIGEQSKVVSWQLPETVFHHLEILDAQGFRKLFEDVITANKITPSKIIIIFSQNIVFSVDLPPADTESVKRENVLAQFRDQVPFASPFVKEIKLEKGEMAVALNRDTFELMVAQLKSLGFEVATLVTSHLLPIAMPANGMTSALAMEIIKAWPQLESNDFLEPEQKKGFIVSREEQDPKDRNRIFLLIGVFVMLIVILVGVVVFVMQQNKEDEVAEAEARAQLEQQQAAQQVVVPTAEPTAVPVQLPQEQEVVPEVMAERSEYSITIYEPAEPIILASEIEAALIEAGFRKPRIVRANTEPPAVLTVTTSTEVTPVVRIDLRELLSKYDSGVELTTVSGSEAAITITLP